MKFEFDPAKDEANRARHGIGLDAAERFDLSSAYVVIDDRHDELREVAIGFIGVVLHVMVWTWRDGDALRVISLRKAEGKDARTYEQKV